MRSSLVAAIFGFVAANAQSIGYYSSGSSTSAGSYPSESKTGYTSFSSGSYDVSRNAKGTSTFSLDGDSSLSTSGLIGGAISGSGLSGARLTGSGAQGSSAGGNGVVTTTSTVTRNSLVGGGSASGISLGAAGSGISLGGGSGSGLSVGGSGSRFSLGGGSGSSISIGGGNSFSIGGGNAGGVGTGSGNGNGIGSGSGSGSIFSANGGSGSASGSGNGFSIGGGSFSSGAVSGSGNGASIGFSGQYPKADLTRFLSRGSQGQESSSTLNSFRIINQASQNLVTPTRSLDSLFIRFPSSGELDRLIVSADTAAILKTVQTIATDSSVNCNQRITYLLEMLGRLKTAIEKKVYAGNQLKIVITTSLAEIQRLQNQIESTRKASNNLGIADLKDRQAKEIVNLQEAYKKLNAVDSQTPVLQARVLGFQKEIQILTKNSEGQRNRIANDKLKLIDVTGEIDHLQARLKELQDKQAALTQSISKGQAKVAQNDKNIEALRVKIDEIEVQIRRLRDDSDKINSQVRDLEVKVERLRTDVAVAETKKDRFLKQISNLDDRLSIEKKKAVEDDLSRMNEMISTLKTLVPAVQGAIDRHYYNCYGEGSNVKVEQAGEVVVYIVSGDKFGDYLRNLYGNSVQVSSIRSDVIFNRVDIFGQEWQSNYGYPFVDSAFGNNDFTFAGSFNCLNPGSVVTGSGVISNIGPNFIEAKDERGGNIRFNLGSCSRLESTHKVPKIGNKFYWSGVAGGQGYNLYGGSCFE